MTPFDNDDGVSDDYPDDPPCAAGDFEVLEECDACQGTGWQSDGCIAIECDACQGDGFL